MQVAAMNPIALNEEGVNSNIIEKEMPLRGIIKYVDKELKDKKLSIVATDLDIIFYDEISDIKIINYRMQHRNIIIK